ncbi:hypothetical protein BpHYR1_033650, partial [Brachionus plicatilis]
RDEIVALRVRNQELEQARPNTQTPTDNTPAPVARPSRWVPLPLQQLTVSDPNINLPPVRSLYKPSAEPNTKLAEGTCVICFGALTDAASLIIRTLFFLCSINKYLTADAAIYKFAASLDFPPTLVVYNGQEIQQTVSLNGLSHSLDFDPNTNLIIGSVEKRVFTWNISQSTVSYSQEETAETRAIAFLNQTHFIAGFNGFFVIYACSNLNSIFKKKDITNIGEVYFMKILHEEQKILIASHEGYISVFNLINYNFLKKNQIANRIWEIDAFDQNLIVSQCNQQNVCLYRLDSSSSLIELKRRQGLKEIFTIKILNENRVVFGGDQFLSIWDISINQIIITISIDGKALSLDIFSSQIIASGDENGGVKFWNITNNSNIKTINTGSKVYYLKNLNGASINYLNLKSNQNSTEIASSNMISFQSSLPSEINKEGSFQSKNEIFMTSTALSTASAFSQPTSVDKLNSFPQTGSSDQFFLSKNLVFGKVLDNHKILESFNQFLIFTGFIKKILCFRKCLILSCHFAVYSDQLGQCQMFSFISSISYFDQSQGYSVYKLLNDSY